MTYLEMYNQCNRKIPILDLNIADMISLVLIKKIFGIRPINPFGTSNTMRHVLFNLAFEENVESDPREVYVP